MKLAILIEKETGVGRENIMFLRHSGDRTKRLAEFGATIDEYTAVQDEDGKYNFLHPSKPPTEVVVVMVGDRVHAVYRVRGVLKTGLRDDISSREYWLFSQAFNKPNLPSIRFDLERLKSGADGARVEGWKAPVLAVLRGSKAGMFAAIEVDAAPIQPAPAVYGSADDYDRKLAADVERSMSSTQDARLARLLRAPKIPRKLQVLSTVFDRNPDVIAEVLCRADGICGGCGSPAPFIRARDGTPYLEVHHRVPLAQGGEDTVENAIALCPNCHRQRHHGEL